MNTLFWKNQTETSRKKLEDLAGEIADMDYTKFTEGEDYASLAKRYSSQGQKAMDDTVGKVAARTGGLASSYATAAGNQAYNEHMGKLEDAARGLYDSQRQEKIDNFNIRNSLYGQYYDAQRDSEANDQWKQQFDREGEQITYDRTQTLVEKEESDLKDAFYYNANAYPTYADYVAAFPGTLITEADFNQIRGIATRMYAEEHNEPVTLSDEDTGELSEFQEGIVKTYQWYIEHALEVPPEIQEQYNAIFGIPSPQVAEYSNKIAEAATYDEAYALVMELAEIDEDAAMEALLAWEKEHGELVPNRYYDKASNAGYKFDMKQLS